MAYYNTTQEEGQQLIQFEENAEVQEKLVLEFFKKHPAYAFTPYECMDFLRLPDVPITSIRRSITDLTGKDLLIKTGKKKIGKYGRPNFTWKLNNNL